LLLSALCPTEKAGPAESGALVTICVNVPEFDGASVLSPEYAATIVRVASCA